MSFEKVFEKWLKTGEKEENEDDMKGGSEQQQRAADAAMEKMMEDESDVQQDAWGQEVTKNASMNRVVKLSPKQMRRKVQSSAPPLQVTISLKDSDDRKSKDLPELPHHKNKIKNPIVQAETGKEISEQSISSLVCDKHMKQNSDMERQDHQECHTHSALTDLSDMTSPTAARALRVEPVLSPEQDVPMEPDSTSEHLATNKCTETRKKYEGSMRGVSQGREDSPCSTGCAGDTTGRIQSNRVSLRVEDGQAECDSTCMFLASPSAISPASQGEIEERVCPILTDHEDGASPAHCVCQCRSLPPPANLLPRDHVPITSTATSASPPSVTSPHLNVRVSSANSDSSSFVHNSKPPLVSHNSTFECKTTLDVEQASPKVDLNKEQPEEKTQSKPVSPNMNMLILPEKEAFRDHAETASTVKVAVSKVKRNPAFSQDQCDVPELSIDEPSASKGKHSRNPVVSVNSKHGPKQAEMCDFAKHIDWDTAVAETFESSSSMTKCGENKRGIILKIRTKAVVPCLERNLETKHVKTASTLKRKGHSVDSPEILSRLRKRRKSEVDKPEVLECWEQKHSDHCKSKDKQQRSGPGSGCSCSDRSVPERKRRNTVQLGGDLKAYMKHLSPTDYKFVESTTRLSRLQTQTYDFVCTVFPLLRKQLSHITPESHHFTQIIDDIISSLECSNSEEVMKDFEQVCEQFEKLTVERNSFVPVYSPQVTLCNDPRHSLEDFQDKVCSLLQLLLPDLTVSLTNSLSESSDQLGEVLKRVLIANKLKHRPARKCKV